jgi:hypothetical protein
MVVKRLVARVDPRGSDVEGLIARPRRLVGRVEEAREFRTQEAASSGRAKTGNDGAQTSDLQSRGFHNASKPIKNRAKNNLRGSPKRPISWAVFSKHMG